DCSFEVLSNSELLVIHIKADWETRRRSESLNDFSSVVARLVVADNQFIWRSRLRDYAFQLARQIPRAIKGAERQGDFHNDSPPVTRLIHRRSVIMSFR